MKLEDLKKNLGKNRMDESKIGEVIENDRHNNSLIDRLYKAVIVAEVIAMNQERLPKEIETDKESDMHSALNSIFRIMHTATIPKCMDSHPKWEEEFQKAVENLGVDQRTPINREQLTEGIARILCKQHGRDPDSLEPGDLPVCDKEVKGEPLHYSWRDFVNKAETIVKFMKSCNPII